jgi:hypothetical protein
MVRSMWHMMNPARTPVSPTPTVRPATISSASGSRARARLEVAEIGQAHRLPGETALAAVHGLPEHDLDVDEEMLLGRGDAHRLPSTSRVGREGSD